MPQVSTKINGELIDYHQHYQVALKALNTL